jgi:hypothetical protein
MYRRVSTTFECTQVTGMLGQASSPQAQIDSTSALGQKLSCKTVYKMLCRSADHSTATDTGKYATMVTQPSHSSFVETHTNVVSDQSTTKKCAVLFVPTTMEQATVCRSIIGNDVESNVDSLT